MNKPKYAIGQKFKRRGLKHAKIETVSDIYTTTNTKGEVVSIRYKTELDYLGQTVYNHDTLETTIARGEIK